MTINLTDRDIEVLLRALNRAENTEYLHLDSLEDAPHFAEVRQDIAAIRRVRKKLTRQAVDSASAS